MSHECVLNHMCVCVREKQTDRENFIAMCLYVLFQDNFKDGNPVEATKSWIRKLDCK